MGSQSIVGILYIKTTKLYIESQALSSILVIKIDVGVVSELAIRVADVG